MRQVGSIPIGCSRYSLGMTHVFGRAIAAMVLTCAFGAVSAQEFVQLPSLARVVDIAQDDVLNIRADATAGSADIGDLPPGARIEIVALNDDATWAQIVVGEGNGWVATRYLDPVARPQTDGGLPLALRCAGTEPFWSAELATDATVTFSVVGANQDQQGTLAWSGTSRNLGPGAYGFAASGMTGVLRRAECTDGMSDSIYGWALDVVLNGDAGAQLYSGCCTGN